MKIKRLTKYLFNTLLVGLAIFFIIKFAGPNLLTQYISYGIGDCKRIPILCMEPDEKITLLEPPSETDLQELVLQKFPRMSILCPKGFAVIQELIKRPYYKRNTWLDHGRILYLLYQAPGEFIKLYPDVKKHGVNNNYEFMQRLTSANIKKVRDINDAFFVIMKSVFTPNLGSQQIVKMIQIKTDKFRGFINYNLSLPDSYYDCNIIDAQDNFYKIYIKDIGNRLDLNKVFAIISTIKPTE